MTKGARRAETRNPLTSDNPIAPGIQQSDAGNIRLTGSFLYLTYVLWAAGGLAIRNRHEDGCGPIAANRAFTITGDTLMHSQTVHVEGLESRTFLSATSVFNTTVLADRLQVRMDLLQFRLDGLTCSTTLLKDVTTARADGLAKATTAKPSIKQFHADVQAMRHTLQADRLNEATNVLKDEITILGDRRQLLKDAGNATAQAADHAKLLADRIHLQNDMIAGLDARLATRQAAYDKIFADIQSIGDAVTADPNASDALKADVQKWMTDRTNCLNTMTADIQKLVADRTQLANDLTASQSQG